MHVLIADKFEQSGIDALQHLGCKVTNEPSADVDTLVDFVKRHDPDVLIVRSTKVKAPVFEAANKLSLVVRAGAGVDNIDVDAASASGISVANCPGKNAIAVAELAWGLILAADRLIPEQTADLRAGAWAKKHYAKQARGLFGRTLGVVGIGNIGKEIIKRAHAFGMPVVAWSRSLTDADAKAMGAIRVANVLDVARMADVVSINVAATPETKSLVSKDFLDAMKAGATLINTARGSVVDEDALAEAIKTKHIRAGLDVWANQPTPDDKTSDLPLVKLEGVVGTHHCGASTDQAQQAIADEAVRIIRAYKDTGEIPNVVNRAAKSSATRLLIVRHLNRPGVLAHVVGRLSEAKLNIEEMENVIYSSAKAACAKIRLDAEPESPVITAIRTGNPNILSVDLTVIE
ncbi:MAG: hypothetical protein KDA20_11090 [Phycisphaerales bacterium]|nr:hypothetical protein [Phycisphaerales bacterium]